MQIFVKQSISLAQFQSKSFSTGRRVMPIEKQGPLHLVLQVNNGIFVTLEQISETATFSVLQKKLLFVTHDANSEKDSAVLMYTLRVVIAHNFLKITDKRLIIIM